MIGKILNAVLQEAKYFLLSENVGAQIILRTNFKSGRVNLDKNIPLILLGLDDAPDTYLFPGGLTMCGWKFSFHSYAYSPDAYQDDNSGYSNELLYDPVDTIRRHFSIGGLGNGLVYQTGELNPGIIYQVQLNSIVYNGNTFKAGTYFTCLDGVTTFTTLNGYCVGTSWLTQGMVDMFNSYGFQFTLNGISTAENIDDSGLLLGYRIDFESVSLDSATLLTQNNVVLEEFIETAIGSPWILEQGIWNDGGRWIDDEVWID